MDENVLERMHKEHKRLLMMLGHMPDYQKRETYLHERRAAMNDPVVLDLSATVEADRKRNFTPATLEKRKEMMKKTDGELLAKVEAAVRREIGVRPHSYRRRLMLKFNNCLIS